MKKGVVIAVALLLALLAAAGITIATIQKEDSPPVRIIEGTMDNNTNTSIIAAADNEIIKTQNAQIEEQRAKIEELERRMAQRDFDYSALKAEKDKLERRSRDLEEQNSWLRSRNNSLSNSENKLKDDIASLNAELARISKEREADEAAYEEALAKIEEYEARNAVMQAELEEANKTGTRVTQDGRVLSTFKSIPYGQSRNIIGIKAGETDIDLEAAFALMPHWFLVTEIGVVDAPDDFVSTEFPGLTADHAFMFTALFGTGLNWRLESLHGQPNFYIETMLGPAMYRYIIKNTDEKGINTYLLWRSAVGFDLTLYKNLQFTTEVGLDYIINCELTPRVTIGLQWNFSNSWSLFGRK